MVCYLWDYLEVARLVVLQNLVRAIWSKLKFKKEKKEKKNSLASLDQSSNLFKYFQIKFVWWKPTWTPKSLWEWWCARQKNHQMIYIISIRNSYHKLRFCKPLKVRLDLRKFVDNDFHISKRINLHKWKRWTYQTPRDNKTKHFVRNVRKVGNANSDFWSSN